MKKALVAVVVVVVLAVAAGLVWRAREKEEAGPLTLYGNVDLREVELAFRQSGRVAEVLVEEGDVVEAGAPIARLDDEPFHESLAAADARLQVAQANLERLESGSRPQEIEQARAAVTEAEARLQAAQLELARKDGLRGSGATSQREFEAAREKYDAAVARRAAAEQALSLALAGFRTEDVAAGRAELSLARAQLEQARTALDDTRLVAPSPGAVLTRAREPGAMVRAGDAIATLSLRDPVVVRAYVSEAWLGQVAPGTPVEITTDSAERSYHGRVGFVAPRAEFTPKTVETRDLRTDLVYRLRIIVEDADERLLQGMPVTVRLAAGGARG